MKKKIEENWNTELPEELKQKLAEIVAGIIIDFKQKWVGEIEKKIEQTLQNKIKEIGDGEHSYYGTPAELLEEIKKEV